jgi:threonine/homoserine efflux transporter RhtA
VKNLNQLKNVTLLRLGFAALALRAVLQTLLDRTHHTTDTTDFFLGVLFGVGLGLLILYFWRNGRGNRGQTNSSCS